MPDAPISPAKARAAYAPREKPRNVNLVTGFIIIDKEAVAIEYNFLEPETDGTTKDFLEYVAISAYSVVITDSLNCVIDALTSNLARLPSVISFLSNTTVDEDFDLLTLPTPPPAPLHLSDRACRTPP